MYITTLLIFLLIAGSFKTAQSDKLEAFDKANTLPLRGLLAILIVIHHTNLTPPGCLTPDTQLLSGLGGLVVAVFFFLSGYGLYVSYSKKKEEYLSGFLSKRFLKILPAFIILSIISVVIRFYAYGESIPTQLEAMKHGITLLPYSWFIFAIIYVYLAFYASALLGKNLMNTGLIFTAFLFAYFLLIKFGFRLDPLWYRTILCTSAGYYIGYYEKQLDNIQVQHKLLLICTVLALLCINVISSYLGILQNHFISMGWFILKAFAVYLIIRCLGMWKTKSLILLGEISLDIYLVHGIFVHLFVTKVASVSGVGLHLVVLFCSIIAALTVHRIISLAFDKRPQTKSMS